MAAILKELKAKTGTVESCASILKEGNILAISPGNWFNKVNHPDFKIKIGILKGGGREALFSNYEVMWGSRDGFSKAATLAKCVCKLWFRK